MSIRGGFDSSDPVRPEPVGRLGSRYEERDAVTLRLGTGTLACPLCDAPVAPAGVLAPADPLGCPFCDHTAAVRDFLSLTAPSRPARVEIRVVRRARPAAR
ncbi:MAG: hypothetical protein QOD44_4236 [Solirubrobacteraceae bacterium]|nr:hypothetical protein [Solirubrobacteraceae bacterium]MEA2320047.1 hypothetical protein [Solirubrobacteraceae bacterium]